MLPASLLKEVLYKNNRFGDFDAGILEKVSYETFGFQAWRMSFGGSLVQTACFCQTHSGVSLQIAFLQRMAFPKE